MLLKEKIDSSHILYSSICKLKNRIPKKLVYQDKYFQVIDLLEKQDSGMEIENILNNKLSSILKNAIVNVPYYRNLKLNIKPNEINMNNAKEVLKVFPYLSKKNVIENSEAFISDLYNKKKLVYTISGGSTGQDMGSWSSREEQQIEKAFFDYNWGKLGYKSYSKLVRISCEGLKKEDENPISYAGYKMRISPNHLNKKWIELIYNEIKEFRPEFFHAYPSSFQYLLQYMKLNDLRINGVKGIFLASEIITEKTVSLSKEIFKDVPIIFHYGLSERSNLAWGIVQNSKVAYKCENVYGYSENYITKDGFFEIVGTSYWNYAMPLIRYRTQDIGEITNGIINNLDGRSQEFLITKEGEKVPGINICIDKFIWDHVELVQVVQNEPGKIEFHVKAKSYLNNNIKEEILNSQRILGEMFDISVIEDNKISKTKSGKVRLIISNIK